MQTIIHVLKMPAVYISLAVWALSTLKLMFTSRPAVEHGLDLLMEALGSGSYKGEVGQLGRFAWPVFGRSRRAVTAAPAATPPAPTPPAAAASLLVPFLIATATLLCSCATPAAQAGKQTLQTCEVNSLPQTEQSAMLCGIQVVSGATQPVTSVQPAIANCVASLVPQQASCLIQGLISWLKGSMPPHGQVDSNTLLEINKLETYLAAHPTKADCSCGTVSPNAVSDFVTPTTRPLWAVMASGGVQ